MRAVPGVFLGWRRALESDGRRKSRPARLGNPVAAAICLLWPVTLIGVGLPIAAAESAPEPLPSYSYARHLREDSSLRAIAFRSSQSGVAVGDRGVALWTDDGGENWHPAESGVTCQLSDVLWVGDRSLVAVGGASDRITQLSRGVVVWSDDGGRSWRRGADQDLPRLYDLERHPEGRLLVRGGFSYPELTNVFERSRGGKRWQGTRQASGDFEATDPAVLAKWARALQRPIAIRGACRVGETTIWACGDHGALLRSDDAGGSWNAVRGGDRRTTLLIVAAELETVAWPLVAREALEHGHRVAVLVVESVDVSRRGQLEHVTMMLGGAAADALRPTEPVPQALPHWLSVHQPLVVAIDRSMPDELRDLVTERAVAHGVRRVVSYAEGETGSNKNSSWSDSLASRTVGRGCDRGCHAMDCAAAVVKAAALAAARV